MFVFSQLIEGSKEVHERMAGLFSLSFLEQN
jgi:hypothetical protein